MWSFFKKSSAVPALPYRVDFHSHLLPGLDDGSRSIEDTEMLLSEFNNLGVKRIITTPHIMHDTYRNSKDTILPALERVKASLTLPITIDAAAEYYLDEELIKKVECEEPLLTFGDKMLLFETNYLTEPFQLKDFIFKATTQGYKLVMAHPERYQYMSLRKAEELRDRGVLFQVNLLSFIGFYMKPVQVMAQKLVEQKWVDGLGSDCHNLIQVRSLHDVFKNRHFKLAMELPILNHSL